MSKAITVAGVAITPSHFIGGEPSFEGSGSFEVVSPIEGNKLADMPAGSVAEVERAVQAARAAFPAWAALGPEGRGPILERFAEGILARKAELSAVETEDNGSLLIANQKRIVDRAAHNIAFFAKRARTLAAETVRSPIAGHECDNHVRYEPAGVAALITPWNAPLMLSTWKLGPALAAGNTVVLKPAEWAPLSSTLLAEIAFAAGVPAGVLNIVQGLGAQAGQALIEHPDIDRISFTGSIATGKKVAAAAAQNLTPVSLELGGKSPFIVLDDADLDAAAATIAMQFGNAGQVCLAGTRVLVAHAIEAELRERVLKATSALPVGDPRVKSTRAGPLIHPRQLERVSGFVERAIAAGAKPLIGGKRHALGGLYYEPTIVTNVAQGSEIVQNEVFGPVLTWQTFESDEELITLANGTEYGLAAMLFSQSPERAQGLSAALVAGTVWVNCYFSRDLEAPFGGARSSGIGREGGAFSFEFFCDVKNVAVKRTDRHG
jgi:5-carboxymethyl-2-hydroxymuconic-semialdehyde dehydrogenase